MSVFLILWVIASFVNLGVSVRTMFYLKKASRTEREKILDDPSFQNMAVDFYKNMSNGKIESEVN